MKNQLFQYLFLACLLVLSGCKKDAVNPDDDEPNLNNPILQLENERLDNVVPDATVFVFLQGYIEDEFGQPLADATVKVSGITKTTDANGYFLFEGIDLNESYAMVRATKEGYHKNFRTFTPKANTVQTVKIQLLTKGISKNFNSNSGGILEFESGKVKLVFPAKSIIKRDGSAYNGNVSVIARYIDPESENLLNVMPGMLAGLTDDDEIAAMITFGMVTVELTDNNGNALEVNPDSKVEVRLPASASGPGIIPLWHFNETYGLWIEAGTATKVGSEYVGEVNHFSTWNLDIKVEPFTFHVKVTNQEGIPIPNLTVEVFDNEFDDRYISVYSDDNGEFSLLRAPQELGFRVVTDCEEVDILPQILGDSMFVVLDEEDLEIAISYSLNGTIKDCDNLVYANKWMQFSSIATNLSYFGQTNAQGQYSFTNLLCGINTSITYQVNARIYLDGTLGTVKDTTLAIIFSGSGQALDINYCGVVEDTLTDATEIIFPDPNLEQAIRGVINQPNGPLLYGSVKTIDNLVVYNSQVSSLEGLEYLTGLKILNMDYCQINNISPISNLINLEELSFYQNQIDDLDPLIGLVNLQKLFLNENEIEDINVLSGLVNLKVLSLQGNPVQNINPLSNLVNLETLDLSFISQSNFNELAGLVNLKELSLVINQIEDISFLSNLVNLERLALDSNRIDNISVISNLINLTNLSLSYNKIEDLSSLSGFNNNFTNLYLSFNKIIDLTPLCNIGYVEEGIYLTDNTPPFTPTQKADLEACLPITTIFWEY
jgi:Leucine-rich repeat (LRR) protein